MLFFASTKFNLDSTEPTTIVVVKVYFCWMDYVLGPVAVVVSPLTFHNWYFLVDCWCLTNHRHWKPWNYSFPQTNLFAIVQWSLKCFTTNCCCCWDCYRDYLAVDYWWILVFDPDDCFCFGLRWPIHWCCSCRRCWLGRGARETRFLDLLQNSSLYHQSRRLLVASDHLDTV